MPRFLLSVASIFVLVITGLIIPRSADARRCEDRMPLTLLSLYRTSDAIYAGRYEKNEDGEVTEETPEYRIVPIKKHFSISSTLKGEPRKLLTIGDTDYRYKNAETATDVVEEEPEHGDGGDEYEEPAKPGDSVLLFVAKNADTGEVNLTEPFDGIKKMTPEKLSAYEARIKDLKGILSAEKPKYSKLVNWMIRNAENPHTRWEGTFELLQSFQNMDWQDERAKEAKNKPADSVASEADSESEFEGPKDFETGDPGFARSVTDAHKRALTNILLSREPPKKWEDGGTESVLGPGDRELIELVKRWGDARVASNLLDQLRGDQSDVTLNYELMLSISSMFADEDLTAIAEEYGNIQWETDEEEIRDESGEAGASENNGEQAAPVVKSDVEATDEPDTEEPNDDSKSEAKKKKTYGELRAELMGKFVSKADKLIARERNKRTAKLNR